MSHANVIRLAKALLVPAEERQRMIAEMAYYIAEQRQFQGGEAAMVRDWIEAESQIDRLIRGDAEE